MKTEARGSDLTEQRTEAIRRIMEAEADTLQRITEAIRPPRRKGQLITSRQAAERLGVCKRTLQRWVNSGRITVIKHSQRSHRYLQDEIDELAYTGLISGVDQQSN